jgi:hypothetical protein
MFGQEGFNMRVMPILIVFCMTLAVVKSVSSLHENCNYVISCNTSGGPGNCGVEIYWKDCQNVTRSLGTNCPAGFSYKQNCLCSCYSDGYSVSWYNSNTNQFEEEAAYCNGCGGGDCAACLDNTDCDPYACGTYTFWCDQDYHVCTTATPIVIDTLGDGFDLTDGAHGVNFDLNYDGIAEGLAWTSANADDAWLVLDRNGNDKIDNGTELFGNVTEQPRSSQRNGFLALAVFDQRTEGGNRDGKIDNRDAVFFRLRLWQDINHNGISESWELHSLPELDVTGIDLDYKESRRTDQYGNQFKYRTRVSSADKTRVGRWAWDVVLLANNEK